MKRLVSTLTLAAVLSLGTSQLRAGIIVGTITEQPTQCENQKSGIIVGTLATFINSVFGVSLIDVDSGSCQSTGIIVGT